MTKATNYYGVVKMSNKVVGALGCACYCTCFGGDDSAQVGTLSNYISSSSYR